MLGLPCQLFTRIGVTCGATFVEPFLDECEAIYAAVDKPTLTENDLIRKLIFRYSDLVADHKSQVSVMGRLNRIFDENFPDLEALEVGILNTARTMQDLYT